MILLLFMINNKNVIIKIFIISLLLLIQSFKLLLLFKNIFKLILLS